MKHFLLFVVLILVFSSRVYSQADTTFKFILPDLKIHQNDGDKSNIYTFDKEYNFFVMRSDTLYSDSSQYFYAVQLNKIKSIDIMSKVPRDKSMTTSIGVGLGAGLLVSLVGFVTLDNSNMWNVFWLFAGTAAVTSIVFGIVTGEANKTEFKPFHFPESDLTAKKQHILKVLRKYNYEK